MAKERLDIRMVQEGLAPSREKAKALIMAGTVYVDGLREDKAGTMIREDAAIEVRGPQLKYVSRGGLKLEKAMAAFSLDLKDKVCIDAGASTGGFTDCMLQNGARHVYAVDVGYGQLAWKLRQDERVTVLEKTNVRYLDETHIPEPCDFASFDLSFISLTKTIPAVAARLKDDGTMVALIKPQFEAGREQVGKKGVVRDPKVHEQVVRMICDWCTAQGLMIKGLTFSPVRGPEGNIEYLIYLSKDQNEIPISVEERISEVVKESHEEL